ncbi:hypothetical protein [Infirmifilum sp. SLHALR2]|nr:MAG: hypothetical protein B7L53_02555 [Thermofilum sp. NZ13]
MPRIIPVAGLAVFSESDFEELDRRLSLMEGTGAWIQIVTTWNTLVAESVGEVVDAFYDRNLYLASLRFGYVAGIDVEDFEKICMMADESAGRTIIILRPGEISSRELERMYDVAATYKVKVLLEPGNPSELRRVSRAIGSFAGGVMGLSMTEEDYPSTDSFAEALRNNLQITRNLNISNYEEGQPASILIPSQYNNPKLLRFLVKQRFEGFLTLFYGRGSVDDAWLIRQILSLKEQLASLEEGED